MRCSVFYILNDSIKFYMMTVNTGGRVQFEYIFLIVNHLVFKIGRVIDIVMCNIFKEYFVLLGGLGPTAILFL